MTRKDYVAIAEAFASTIPYYSGNQDSTAQYREARSQWEIDVRTVADVLAADNPRFDRERFYRACEGGK